MNFFLANFRAILSCQKKQKMFGFHGTKLKLRKYRMATKTVRKSAENRTASIHKKKTIIILFGKLQGKQKKNHPFHSAL